MTFFAWNINTQPLDRHSTAITDVDMSTLADVKVTGLVTCSASSSGVSSGASVKNDDSNSETTSTSSFGTSQGNQTQDKILALCEKGEWMLLEHKLRHIDKGSSELYQTDEVGKILLYIAPSVLTKQNLL